MANTKKYVSFDKLGLYDDKIKNLISTEDAAALAAAKSYADDLAVNYDAAGSAATAEANAKSYAESAAQAAEKTALSAHAAATEADGKAVKAQGDVDALKTYVGTIPTGATATDIVGYVQEKTSGIATEGAMTELGNRVTVVEGKVATIEGDYLKAADKTELEGKITAVETAVGTEKTRAEGVEAGLRTDIDTVMGDYLKAADKTELQGNIDTVSSALERLTNGVSAEEIDGVNDLIQYVKDHGADVKGFQDGIKANADDIDALEGRMDTAEGKITAVEGAVATKAEKEYVDEQIEALQGVDTGLGNRITALEGKFTGEGSVEGLIAAAKAEAISTAAGDATTKANTAEANAKSHADGLNTAMDGRVAALEAIDHDHANKAELDLIASGDKAKWDAAAGIAHSHDNKTVLDGINAAKVQAWDAAEQNAKTYADGLNTAMNTRVATLESWHENFVECSQEDIQSLFA